MRVVFFGSPELAVHSLEALQSSAHEVVAVVTQPDRPFGRRLHMHAPPVKVAARASGIPVLQPATTRTPEFVGEIASFGPDILVVVAYGEILRRSLLDAAPRGAVNLHASLLPRYRGAAPIAWAILNGESETGCSTMLIQEAMDAGPILLQEKCEILPGDTTGTLTARLSALGAPLLRKTLDLLQSGEIEPREQNPSEATFAPKLKKEQGRIDWLRSAAWISRQVRAFDPWPGSFSYWSGHLIKFWRTEVATEYAGAPPGTILRIERPAILVACGEGSVLRILEVQPENRPRLTAQDFANGAHLQPGGRFES